MCQKYVFQVRTLKGRYSFLVDYERAAFTTTATVQQSIQKMSQTLPTTSDKVTSVVFLPFLIVSQPLRMSTRSMLLVSTFLGELSCADARDVCTLYLAWIFRVTHQRGEFVTHMYH